MNDPILWGFLAEQHEAGMALATSSDLLKLQPVGRPPYQRYVARYSCRGLRRLSGGQVVETEDFHVGIRFGDDHLRRLVEPMQVVTLLSPPDVFHPNIRFPFICLGNIRPGMGLVDLLYQVWEVLSFRKVVVREDDALNADACRWARSNQARFPTDGRSLKRARRRFEIRAQAPGGGT